MKGVFATHAPNKGLIFLIDEELIKSIKETQCPCRKMCKEYGQTVHTRECK